MKLLKGNGAKGMASLTFYNLQPKGMIDYYEVESQPITIGKSMMFKYIRAETRRAPEINSGKAVWILKDSQIRKNN